jgi:hypothetical protein
MSNKTTIALHCQLCGKESGVQLKLGELRKRMPEIKKMGDKYLHGTCQECNEHLKQGGVFFADKSGRSVKVSVEASKSKISAAYHGKVVVVPASAMNELISIHLQHKQKNNGIEPPATPG